MTRRTGTWAALAGGILAAGCGPAGGDAAPDRTPPQIALTDAGPRAWVTARRIRITATVTDDTDPAPVVTARLQGTPLPDAAARATPPDFALDLDPPAGVSELVLEARDQAGNTAEARITLETGTPLAAGIGHSGALTAGALSTWGANDAGQLGRKDAGAQAAPGRVALAEGTLTSIAFPVAGAASFALDAQGQIWGFGAGLDKVPARIDGAARIVQIAAGAAHQLALRSDGTVFAWGRDDAGQLGLGTASGTPVSKPAPVSGLADVVALCAGTEHSVAVRADGVVFAWGANDAGQLGLGSADGAAHPTPGVVDLLSGVTAVACGRDHTLALRTDGTVWAWGLGSSGQLGHGGSGNQGSRPQPGPVADLTGVRNVAAAANASWAIDRGGRLWAWGQNSWGQLGLGSTGEKRRPTQAALAGVLAVAAGATHALFRTTDGRTWASGSNGSIQLGAAGGDVLAPREVTVP